MLIVGRKLIRAAKHLEAIKDAIAEDVARYGDSFIIESDGKETVDLPEPDPDIAVLVGEFVYQLRSSLDHLAFDLVNVNRGSFTLPTDWEESCQFPIWTNPLKPGQTTPLPYGVFKNLPGIPREAHAIIESVQPYYRIGVANNCLRLLNLLSNIDKHRRLALTRFRAKISHNIVYKSGLTGASLETLDHGAEVTAAFSGEDDPVVGVERSASLIIAFDEWKALGDATTVGVEYLLELIFDSVAMEVVAALNPFLN